MYARPSSLVPLPLFPNSIHALLVTVWISLNSLAMLLIVQPLSLVSVPANERQHFSLFAFVFTALVLLKRPDPASHPELPLAIVLVSVVPLIYAFPMHLVSFPFTLVDVAVFSHQLSHAFLQIINKFSRIGAAIFSNTLTIPLVLLPEAFVRLAVRAYPLSDPIPLVIQPRSFVTLTQAVVKNSFSRPEIVLPLPSVVRSIWPNLIAFSLPFILFPHPFVYQTVASESSFSLTLVVMPLSLVDISSDPQFNTVSFNHSIDPLAIIAVTVHPLVLPASIVFIPLKLASVHVPIVESLGSVAMLDIILPFPLVARLMVIVTQNQPLISTSPSLNTFRY